MHDEAARDRFRFVCKLSGRDVDPEAVQALSSVRAPGIGTWHTRACELDVASAHCSPQPPPVAAASHAMESPFARLSHVVDNAQQLLLLLADQ